MLNRSLIESMLGEAAPAMQGGALDLWLDDLTTPLSAIRERPEGYSRLPLNPGDSILLHGGVVPHRIPPIDASRARVVSLMCFEIVRQDTRTMR